MEQVHPGRRVTPRRGQAIKDGPVIPVDVLTMVCVM